MSTFNLANRVQITNPNANVDIDYGPYNSVIEAKSAVLEVIREKGKTVGILIGGSVVEYWWKSGILDSDLVVKSVDFGASNEIEFVEVSGQVTANIKSLSLTLEKLNNIPTMTILGNSDGVEDKVKALSTTVVKTMLALNNVNNTYDIDKPISTLQAAGLTNLQNQINSINTILSTDDIDLDTLEEVVAAIRDIQNFMDTILVNDLTTGGTTKALTAEQGVILKGLIDSLTIDVGQGSVFTTDISVNLSGVKTLGQYKNGDVIASNGKSFQEVINMIANEVINPTYELPTLNIALSITNDQEVGTSYSANLTNTFSRGKILGKIVGSTWNATDTQDFRSGPVTTYEINGTTQAGASLGVSRVLALGANVFTSIANYSVGPQPKNSLGSNFQTALPAGLISKSLTITARKKQFHGNTTSVINSSSLVRTLPLNSFENINSFSINLNTTKYVIAVPDNKSITNVVTSNNESILANFGTPVVFNVSDAGSGSYSYKVYTFESALPLNLNANVTLS